MKKINKRFIKKLCSLCVALAMVLSMAGSLVVTAYATELGDDLIILEDSSNDDLGTEMATPSDAIAEVATPLDGTVINAGIVGESSLNGAPADTPIDVVDVTITVPKVGEVNPSASIVANGEGYTISVGTTEGNEGWLGPGGYIIAPGEVLNEEIHLPFTVKPEVGYTLTQETIVLVNGSTENVDLIGGSELPASQVDYKCFPQLDGTIEVIELLDVPTPVIGQKAIPYSATKTNYSLTGTWMVYDAEINDYKAVDGTHTFANGNIYKLQTLAKADVGYVFSGGVSFHTNLNYYDPTNMGDNIRRLDFITAFATEIDKVNISEDDLPKAEVGKTFENKLIEVPVPEGSNYKVLGYWVDENGSRSGTFQDDSVYNFLIEIYPNAGYALADDVGLYIDGKFYMMWGSPDIAEYMFRYSFATIIHKVYASNVPVAALGEAIKMGETGAEFPLEVPTDANYTAIAWWRLADGSDVTEDTFQSGKSYRLIVEFTAKEGYEFADPLIMNINGVDYSVSPNADDWISYQITYSFNEVIDKIQVEGYKEPVVGEKASTDTLRVPDGANYQIVSAVWYDTDLWMPAETFEEGHSYDLQIRVEPKAGYEFSPYAEILFDSEVYNDEAFVEPEEAMIFCAYTSFKTTIPEVRVDNVPEMKIGEKALVAATVPADANYSITSMIWMVWDDKLEGYVAFDGTFEAGKHYRLSVTIIPEPGYEFVQGDTVVYVNGTVDESIDLYPERLFVIKEYSSGLKVIDRVEVTVEEPVVGGHSSILPMLTVSEGANYKASENILAYWMVEKNGAYYNFDGYFADGESYGAVFEIIPKEGYVFAENVTIIVNDTVISKNDRSVDSNKLQVVYFYDASCDHIYGDWEDAKDGTHTKTCDGCGHKVIEKHTYDEATGKCSVCGAEKPGESTGGAQGNKPGVADDGNPATGDSFAMTYVLALMAMCGAGIYALERRRKKAGYEE